MTFFSAIRRTASSVFLVAALCAAVQAAPESGHWVASWAAAPQRVPDRADAPSYNKAPAVDRQTVRQIIYTRLAGNRVRLHLSNRYGSEPLVIARTHIALSRSAAATDAASDTLVTFHGKAEAVIPAGGELRSDPVALAVPAGGALAVSFYVDHGVRPLTWHKLASQVNYLSDAGNHAAEPAATVFRKRFTSYLWLDGLDVDTGTRAGDFAVAAIGDSITDGMRSTLNANRRWPDMLARRLVGTGVSVVNLGVSGNRLLNDSACYGERMVARFTPDALEQSGVRDIDFPAMRPRSGLDCDAPHTAVSAADMAAGYESLIAAARARHIRLIGATLTPASFPPAREEIRLAVNHWIRTSGKFDAVIDFDAALRDPAQPSRLIPRFDSGDHVHPSDAGYAEMAGLIPLKLLGVSP
jgi:lysophospholipase L1-like esterase